MGCHNWNSKGDPPPPISFLRGWGYLSIQSGSLVDFLWEKHVPHQTWLRKAPIDAIFGYWVPAPCLPSNQWEEKGHPGGFFVFLQADTPTLHFEVHEMVPTLNWGGGGTVRA